MEEIFIQTDFDHSVRKSEPEGIRFPLCCDTFSDHSAVFRLFSTFNMSRFGVQRLLKILNYCFWSSIDVPDFCKEDYYPGDTNTIWTLGRSLPKWEMQGVQCPLSSDHLDHLITSNCFPSSLQHLYFKINIYLDNIYSLVTISNPNVTYNSFSYILHLPNSSSGLKKPRSRLEALTWRLAWAGDHNISRNNASQAEIFSLLHHCPPDQATRGRGRGGG